MKNEKAHIQKLIQKTNVLVKSLQPANQAYFIDLITYMALSSFLHDEGAVRSSYTRWCWTMRMLRMMVYLLPNFLGRIRKPWQMN